MEDEKDIFPLNQTDEKTSTSGSSTPDSSVSVPKSNSDDEDVFNIDELLEQLGGCGRFQVFLIIVQALAIMPYVFSAMMMVFSGYNPGWRCKDNNTVNNSQSFTPFNETPQTWIKDTCDGFDTCSNVEFSPEASTMVTEWGLACGSSWALSFLISMQMAGSTIGTFFVGSIGDRFGRKIPYQISYIILTVIHLISFFSVSWQMYAAMMLFIGFFEAFCTLERVLMSEYVIEKWRVRINSLPIWSIITIIFSFLAWLLPYWRYLKLIVIILCTFSFFLLFLIPKSLRWLFVQRKDKEFSRVAKKVGHINGKESINESNIQSIFMKNDKEREDKTYFMYHLFKKGYIQITTVIGLFFFVNNLTLCGINFGLSAMPGNFYTNMIILTCIDIPANILGLSVATIYKRRPTAFTFLSIDSICLFFVVGIDFLATGKTREIIILMMVCVAKVSFYVAWMVLFTSMQELYPTVIRGTVNSWYYLMSNLGGVVSPYLIPSDPKWFWVMYLIMATLNLGCALCIFLLPESKGRPMQETFKDAERRKNDQEVLLKKRRVNGGVI